MIREPGVLPSSLCSSCVEFLLLLRELEQDRLIGCVIGEECNRKAIETRTRLRKNTRQVQREGVLLVATIEERRLIQRTGSWLYVNGAKRRREVGVQDFCDRDQSNGVSDEILFAIASGRRQLELHIHGSGGPRAEGSCLARIERIDQRLLEATERARFSRTRT